MPKRKTHDQFILDMKIINPNIIILGRYIKNSIRIDVQCAICGRIWSTLPYNLIQGIGCVKCSSKIKGDKFRLSHDEYINRLNIINDKIEVLGNYVNGNTKILCRCKVDGYEWYAYPFGLLKGHGCPKCAGVLKITDSEFRSRVFEINPNIEILSPYINAYSKVKCRCKIDNFIWFVIPGSLFENSGCPKCCESKGEKRIGKFLSLNNILNIPQKKFDDLYGLKSRKLSYDFYLPEYNLLIEYQGEQHSEFNSYFHKTEIRFEQQLERDIMKREYAKINSINLLEIWYWDFNNIEDILSKELDIKSNSFFIA